MLPPHCTFPTKRMAVANLIFRRCININGGRSEVENDETYEHGINEEIS